MYIRPKLLWWGLPVFLLLFLIGMALGATGERQEVEIAPAPQPAEKSYTDQIALKALLDQLTDVKERSFIVYMKENALNGRYEQERFQLSGEIEGHQLEISRDLNQPVMVRIDGEKQDDAALPYALYTPHEHAELLKGVLPAVKATPLLDHSGEGWRGYHIKVPSQEVASLLALWLGPSFPIQELSPDLAKQVAVVYQIWYDENSGLVKQLEIDLQLQTSVGEKRDQLRFRL